MRTNSGRAPDPIGPGRSAGRATDHLPSATFATDQQLLLRPVQKFFKPVFVPESETLINLVRHAKHGGQSEPNTFLLHLRVIVTASSTAQER